MRSTGLEPVPIAGHAPQTCAYANSATTALEMLLVYYRTKSISCKDVFFNFAHFFLLFYEKLAG